MITKNDHGAALDEKEAKQLTNLLHESMDLSGAIPVLLLSDYDGATIAVDELQRAIYERLDTACGLIRSAERD